MSILNSTLNEAFQKSDNKLSVTLYNSGLVKDGERVGRVTRNTVSLKNIIAEIIEENSGIDPFTVQHSAYLLQQQMLKMLNQGKGVNVLGLGILYIAMKGPVKGDNPEADDIPELILKFTPSSLAKNSIENIVIDKITFSDTNPQIDSITDLWTGQIESCLTPGKTCRINGKKLKLGGDVFSLKLIPLDSKDNEDPSADIINIDFRRISKNTSGIIEFFIPENLESGRKYKIRITTSYIAGNISRKVAGVTDSDALVVAGSSEENLAPAV